MAILTKAQLQAANSSSFPNNNSQAITPQILRDYNSSVIDTLVDSLDTGSFARTDLTNDFSATNNFTSISASSFVSASAFIGDGSKLTNITASVALPILDEGVLQGYATSMNFTGSNITAVVTAGTAVVNVNTSDLITTSSFNSFTSSINSFTASQVTKDLTLATYTASVDTKFTAVGSSTASLNAFTSSQETKNSTLATYTASVDTKFSTIGGLSASWDNTRLNLYTASQDTKNSTLASYTGSNDTKWSTLGTQSGSWITESETGSFITETESGSFLITASVNLNTITFTKGNNTTFAITVNTGSGGGGTADLTSLNAFTASQDTKNTTLASVTSSLNTSASLALYTASFNNGTRNLTFTKGDTTQFSVSIPDTSGSAGTTIFEVVYTGESITKGDPLYISGSQGANPIVYKADAANPLKMPVTFVSNETIGAANTTNAIVLGLIEGIDLTGYTAGQSIYVAEGGGWSTSLPSGSNSITQLLGVVTKGGNGGKGLVLNPGPAQLPGLDTGKMWVGNGSNQPVEITTASFATTGSNSFNGNQIITGSVTISGSSTTDLTVVGQIFVSSSATGGTTAPKITVSGSAGTSTINRNSISTRNTTNLAQLSPAAVFMNVTATTDEIGFSVDASATPNWSTGPSLYINNPTDTYPAVLGFQNKANYTDGRVAVLTPLSASAGFTASLQNGYAWVGNSLGQNTQVATSSFGTAINTGSFITTGSATTGSQTIFGDFKFDTTYTGNRAYTSQGGGSNIVYIDYGDAYGNSDFAYWQSLNFVGVTVNGTGVTNATVTSVGFGTYVEANLSSGTVTNGASYTFTGPLLQSIDITGSLAVQQYVTITTPNGTAQMSDAGFSANGTTFGGAYNQGLIQLRDINNNDLFQFAASSSALLNGGGQFTGPQITTYQNDIGDATIIGFQTDTTWTDGRVTILRPLIAQSGSVITGNTTISGSLILSSSNAVELQVIGNMVVTGSANGNVVALSITSNTASMDLSRGNYFTLTLADTATTHISASNVQPGVSATLVITTGTNSSASLAPTMLQPSGSAYSATNGSAKKDVLSIVAVASGVPFVVSTKNMI